MRDYTKKNKKKAPRAFRKKPKKTIDIKRFFRKGLKVVVNFTIVVASAGVFYGCWLYVMTTPYFEVSKINIEGHSQVAREDILEAASLDGGTNIFSLNISDVGRWIEAVPWVNEVSMERVYPDALNIRIVERTPFALMNLGRFYYFDEGGNIFALANSSVGWNFPVFSGIDKGRLLEGDERTISLIDEGIGLLKLLKRSDGEISTEHIAELHLDSNSGITLYMVKGKPPVHLGRGDFERKLRHAQRVYSDLKRKGIRAARLEADFDDRVLVKVAI